MQRTALITGITGQDGSYLAELLLQKEYIVHGHSRRPAGEHGAAQHLADRLVMHRFAVNEQSAWNRLLAELQPTELYHLAADSFIPNSWSEPLGTLAINTGLPLRLMEAIRQHSPHTRFLNACSREIFGICHASVANEQTEMNPNTLYGISKAASRWAVQTYVQRYGIFATNAILFNHESPRRGHAFVTRKISSAAAMIAHGLASSVQLGDIKVQRDWGYAGDYVEAMWRMLQTAEPGDFVLGTGHLHTIEEFARIAFAAAGLTSRRYVQTVPSLLRGTEPTPIAADIGKARERLGWEPALDFAQLVTMMVNHDLEVYRHQVGRLRVA